MPQRELTLEQIRDRALASDGIGFHAAYWRDRYHDLIRGRRIDELLHFAHYAARMARQHETDGHGWYGRHVVWAISRLVQLGYTFPETEQLRVRLPRLQAAA
jgi:hypothetical protein